MTAPKIKVTLARTFGLVIFLICHTVITLVLILVAYAAHYLILATGDPKLFDAVPLRYLFDAMDAGLIVSYIALGTIGAFLAFRERSDGGQT